jgi:hypothetical protein
VNLGPGSYPVTIIQVLFQLFFLQKHVDGVREPYLNSLLGYDIREYQYEQICGPIVDNYVIYFTISKAPVFCLIQVFTLSYYITFMSAEMIQNKLHFLAPRNADFVST